MTQLKSHPQQRILIVDDDAELRTMLGLILSGEGYAVSHADNGTDAVSLHKQKPFDLIITELILEEKNGFQTLVELRRHHTPVKLIATVRENRLPISLCRRMAKNLGAHGILAKPFQPEELLTAVRKALDQG